MTGNNDPLVYRLNIEKSGQSIDWKAEFITGLNDYHYHTFKMGLTYRFGTKD